MTADTTNAERSFSPKNTKEFWKMSVNLFLAYLEKWGVGELEARKYSDKFMFLVNLLYPTSLSQVIFPQNMRNLSERYFARVYKTKLRFLHKCYSTFQGSHQASQRNTNKLALYVCHITSSFKTFSVFLSSVFWFWEQLSIFQCSNYFHTAPDVLLIIWDGPVILCWFKPTFGQ